MATLTSASVIFSDSLETPNIGNSTFRIFQSGVGDNGTFFNVGGSGIEIQTSNRRRAIAFDGNQFVELDSGNNRGGIAGDTNSSMATAIDFCRRPNV